MLSRNSKSVFRQVDETQNETKIPLFLESEKGYVVGVAAGMTAFTGTVASIATTVYGNFPLLSLLAVDAGALALGGAATIWLAQKMNYKTLAYRYLFKNEKPKVKALLPGQIHVEEITAFLIDESRDHPTNGYYIQTGSQSFSSKPTHEVETKIIQKWNGSFIEQKVTPLAEYVWDDALSNTLEINEITEIPQAELAINTSKASLAIRKVRSKGQAMSDRIQEIEEATKITRLSEKGTTK